jgi:molybdenum cofactor synthesis domain-containing protein
MNKSGIITAVCVSQQKGTVKHPVPSAELREHYGLLNDAHAGPGHRQVSLLDADDIAFMSSKGLDLKPGAFGENLVVQGLSLSELGIGTVLQIGRARLELTQIGKVCHARCAIYQQSGDCIMPRAGVFARVRQGGRIELGVSIEVMVLVPRTTLQAAVLTVSDRCAAGLTQDTAGPATARLLTEELEARIAGMAIVPDEADQITSTLKDLSERGLDLVVTVGGTGCALRDVTPEATRALITREVPGLAEAMRRESALHTPHALLQRGICGLYLSTLIINLPGSEKGAVENLRVILPALPHALKHLRGDTAHAELDVARRA